MPTRKNKGANWQVTNHCIRRLIFLYSVQWQSTKLFWLFKIKFWPLNNIVEESITFQFYSLLETLWYEYDFCCLLQLREKIFILLCGWFKWLENNVLITPTTSCSTNCNKYVQPVKSPGFDLTGFQYFSSSADRFFTVSSFLPSSVDSFDSLLGSSPLASPPSLLWLTVSDCSFGSSFVSKIKH